MEQNTIENDKSTFITEVPPILNINDVSKTLVIGESNSGKTTFLESVIYQLLLMKSKGVPVGLTVIDSTGRLNETISNVCSAFNLQFTCMGKQKDSARFNPLEGDTEAVIRNMTILFNDALGQGNSSCNQLFQYVFANVIRLFKRLYAQGLELEQILFALQDPELMKNTVANLIERDGEDELTDYFQKEFFKKDSLFLKGLTKLIEDIVSNKELYDTMIGSSGFSYKEHIEKGEILSLVTHSHDQNTNDSNLAFLGKSTLVHLQEAVQVLKGIEKSASPIPHFVIVDDCEAVLYDEILALLENSADLNMSFIFTAKSIDHIGKGYNSPNAHYMQLLTLLVFKNKFILGHVSHKDAMYFADLFSKHPEIKDIRYVGGLLTSLPPLHYLYQIKYRGDLTKPSIGKVEILPQDWLQKPPVTKRETSIILINE